MESERPGPRLPGPPWPFLLGVTGAGLLVALAALVTTCAFFHLVLPKAQVENVSPKLRFFAAHKNEFDTLFIGTSRIQHHISPQLFDSLTAQAGPRVTVTPRSIAARLR